MIPLADLDGIRGAFTEWNDSGLPTAVATECARLLNTSDASIWFAGESDQVTVCASSEDARTLDEWQFTYQQGPGTHAVSTRASATATTPPDATGLWPRLVAKARSLGYISIAAVPIHTHWTAFASLNLYDRDRIISAETLTTAQQIADELASLIVEALTRHPLSITQPDPHHQFHQATGMVMTQLRTNAVTAAQTLRTHAWTHDRPLLDVAADVVARMLVFPLLPEAGS